MATKRSFNDMINQYLAYDLLKSEHQKRNFIMTKVETDEDWRGGELVVPFQAGSASSFKYGGLTAVTDVSEDRYVRGIVPGYKEIWGTMKFHSRDIMEHGSVSEQSFLKNLPDTITTFMDNLKQVVSVNFLNGTHFATLTASATAVTGVIVVDRPERFQVQQKVVVKGSVNTTTGFVSGIDIGASAITLCTTRAQSLVSGTKVDFTQPGNIQNLAALPKCHIDGGETAANAFTSIRSQVLPALAGGSSTLFGQTKLAYPYLQSTAVDGTGVTSAQFLDKCFDFINYHRILGRMGADELVMSYSKLGSIMKELESKSGPYRHVDTKANLYGWTTITIVGVKGEFKITAVQEMDNDIVYLADWKGLKVHTNQGFKKHTDPEGKVYTVVRAEDGFEYFVDLCFYGELVLNKPSTWGVLYNLPTNY